MGIRQDFQRQKPLGFSFLSLKRFKLQILVRDKSPTTYFRHAKGVSPSSTNRLNPLVLKQPSFYSIPTENANSGVGIPVTRGRICFLFARD